MATFVRLFTKRFFILFTIGVVLVYLLACLNVLLSPAKYWFISLLGIGFPFLLIIVVVLLFFWIFFKSRWALLPGVAILLSFFNIKALIGFHPGETFQQKKQADNIRILSWNVKWFDEQKKDNKTQRSRRREMLDFIKQQEADVLCFQEFLATNISGGGYDNIREISDMGYPYHYFVGDYIKRNGRNIAGAIIFSRFPIADTLRWQYKGDKKERAAESLLAADLVFRKDTFRVFTTHLQSVLLQKNDYRSISIIRNAEDSMMEASKSILKKLRNGYRFRGGQAEMARTLLDESPHPTLICGDFNDVPNSYTYFTIRGDRQDAFLAAGWGLGRTYGDLSNTLRIDYILPSADFEVMAFRRSGLPYSDHYPILADLRLQ